MKEGKTIITPTSKAKATNRNVIALLSDDAVMCAIYYLVDVSVSFFFVSLDVFCHPSSGRKIKTLCQ